MDVDDAVSASVSVSTGEATLALLEPTDPINPPTMEMMSDEAVVAMLDRIRADRLVLVIEHQRVQRMKAASQHSVLVGKAERLAKKIARSIDKVDDEIAKVETFRHQIQALRIQALDYNEELSGE